MCACRPSTVSHLSIPFGSWFCIFCDTEKQLECLLECEAKGASHLNISAYISYFGWIRPFSAPHQYPSAACHISSAWKQSNHSKRHVGCLRRLSSLFLKHSPFNCGSQHFCEASTIVVQLWNKIGKRRPLFWPSKKKDRFIFPERNDGRLLLKRLGSVTPTIFFYCLQSIKLMYARVIPVDWRKVESKMKFQDNFVRIPEVMW